MGKNVIYRTPNSSRPSRDRRRKEQVMHGFIGNERSSWQQRDRSPVAEAVPNPLSALNVATLPSRRWR